MVFGVLSWRNRWSLRERGLRSSGKDSVQSASMDIEPVPSIPAGLRHQNSPYMHPYDGHVSTSDHKHKQKINRRKSKERVSGWWDSSATRLPMWENLCDELLSPSKRLSLRLDFEPEVQAYPINPVRPTTSPGPDSSKSRKSKTSSKRILKNIPTVNGGFWNLCIRSMPRIRFEKKFEETEV
ncbi:hypothetical protein BDZ91DRAFT_762123 [Kalaharituber pfeilii]|nr:hypothetical protein BDZ91DRAFT_762123 [Kalaharituber pfeilii]